MPKSKAFAVACFLSYLLLIQQVASLSCGECRPTECALKKCQYGFVKDPCNCCNICAKREGEECGGLWGLAGRCAKSLQCTYSPVADGENFYFFRTGVCLPTNLTLEDNLTY